jgi:hypothetical protein
MTHPFGPLMLAGLIHAELPSEARARLNREAFLESRRTTHISLGARLRAFARPTSSARSDLACCTA